MHTRRRPSRRYVTGTRNNESCVFFLSPVNFVGIFCFCDFGTRCTDSMLRACFVFYCNARKVLLQLKYAHSVMRHDSSLNFRNIDCKEACVCSLYCRQGLWIHVVVYRKVVFVTCSVDVFIIIITLENTYTRFGIGRWERDGTR